MKKLFAFILVACMMFSMLAVIASANVDCEPVEFRDENGTPIAYQKFNPETNKVEEFPADKLQNGIVPKVKTPFTIDGVWEDNYYAGLRVNISSLGGMSSTLTEDQRPKGEAWICYDDSYLYLFITVYDSNKFPIDKWIHICPECGKQMGQSSGCEHMEDYDRVEDEKAINLWDDDCIEVFVNWMNDDSYGSGWQYRISRSGYMSYNWDTRDTGFQGKGKDNGNMWYAEYAISLDSSKKGSQFGLEIMLHDMVNFTAEVYEEIYSFDNCSSSPVGTPSFGHCSMEDYMVLGDEIDDIVLNEKPQPPVPVDDPTNPTGGDPTTPGGDPTNPSGPVNPGTGDPIVLVVLAAVAALGAAVTVKKVCFGK